MLSRLLPWDPLGFLLWVGVLVGVLYCFDDSKEGEDVEVYVFGD